ncbi:MAG: class I SAM-dependent methyltransferase [Methanoregulaceae archaeon]|nr:class I SAM-dependent methyltransferase [Methanoregulaceae archaeon]
MVSPVRFWERSAGFYDTGIDRVFGNSMRRIFLDTLQEEQPKLGRTVEFGCGTGYYTPVLARLSEKVVATDIADRMLDRTRERTRDIPTVTVQKENCEKTTFPSASFDTAFLGLTLHLVNGPATLSEMHRILKPGGRLLLTVPTIEGLGLPGILRALFRNLQVFGRLRQPGTVLYTHKTLGDLIASSGFTVLGMKRLSDLEHPGGFSGLYVQAVKE